MLKICKGTSRRNASLDEYNQNSRETTSRQILAISYQLVDLVRSLILKPTWKDLITKILFSTFEKNDSQRDESEDLAMFGAMMALLQQKENVYNQEVYKQ